MRPAIGPRAICRGKERTEGHARRRRQEKKVLRSVVKFYRANKGIQKCPGRKRQIRIHSRQRVKQGMRKEQ